MLCVLALAVLLMALFNTAAWTEEFSAELKQQILLCEQNDGAACNKLGGIFEYGKSTKINQARAIEFYTKACDLNDGGGCANLGWMYESGEGVKQDEFRAAEFYTRACELNNGGGCVVLGDIYKRGGGVKFIERNGVLLEELPRVERDVFRAVELFTKACDLGNGLGCAKLGVAYERGEGVRKDSTRALELFGKACDLKVETGCKNYARLKQ